MNVRGLDPLRRKFDRATDAKTVSAMVAAGTREIAEEIRDEAKTICPVKTGRLQDSIEVKEESEGKFVVQATAHYAAAVEFGTSEQEANPFLRPAAETVRSRMRGIFARTLSAVMRWAGFGA